MAYRTRTFTCGNAQVTVREPIGMDSIDESLVYPKLTYNRTNKRELNRVMVFASWVSRTVSVDGDMGHPWANIDSDEKTMQEAFDDWQQWDSKTHILWSNELFRVAQPPGDQAIQPDADPNV